MRKLELKKKRTKAPLSKIEPIKLSKKVTT
jgi:hypothetical protein